MIWVLASLMPVAVAANLKFVSVTGQCSRQVPPDRASVTLTAEAQEPNPSAAANKVMKLYEKLRTDIKKLSLKDVQLQTSQYTVQADYDYDRGKQRLRGYRASMGIEVETSDIPRIGEVMEVGTKLGVQNVSSFSTYLSPEKTREAHESCLEDAVKNARSKADKMAKASGAKVGQVISMEEFKLASPISPQRMMSKSMLGNAAESMGAPGIETKSESMAVTVYISYELQ